MSSPRPSRVRRGARVGCSTRPDLCRSALCAGAPAGSSEAIVAHDLGPRRDEVRHEDLLGVGARVVLCDRSQLRVGAEDEVDLRAMQQVRWCLLGPTRVGWAPERLRAGPRDLAVLAALEEELGLPTGRERRAVRGVEGVVGGGGWVGWVVAALAEGAHETSASSRLTKKSLLSCSGVEVKTPTCERPVLASRTRIPPTSTAISGAVRPSMWARSSSSASGVAADARAAGPKKLRNPAAEKTPQRMVSARQVAAAQNVAASLRYMCALTVGEGLKDSEGRLSTRQSLHVQCSDATQRGFGSRDAPRPSARPSRRRGPE